MSQESPRIETEAVEMSPELLKVFRKTEALIQKEYGASPSAHELLRLWTACATVWSLKREFEEAVMGVDASTLLPDEEGHYDERSL